MHELYCTILSFWVMVDFIFYSGSKKLSVAGFFFNIFFFNFFQKCSNLHGRSGMFWIEWKINFSCYGHFCTQNMVNFRSIFMITRKKSFSIRFRTFLNYLDQKIRVCRHNVEQMKCRQTKCMHIKNTKETIAKYSVDANLFWIGSINPKKNVQPMVFFWWGAKFLFFF